MRVIGVDPGGVSTGIVVRDGRILVAHTTVKGMLLSPHYPGLVISAIELAMELGTFIALEDTTHPGWHHKGKPKPINLDGLRATERVVGAILGRFSGVILVPPASHGQGPLEAYPEELRPSTGQGRGFDGYRHERSAHDVAVAAVMLVKLASR